MNIDRANYQSLLIYYDTSTNIYLLTCIFIYIVMLIQKTLWTRPAIYPIFQTLNKVCNCWRRKGANQHMTSCLPDAAVLADRDTHSLPTRYGSGSYRGPGSLHTHLDLKTFTWVTARHASRLWGDFCCLLVGCLTSQQQASVSQGRICSDSFT